MTTAREIKNEYTMLVKARLENRRERFRPVKVKGKKTKIEELMEEYVMQCENSISSVLGEDLPKEMITKLDEQKRNRQDQAISKASSPLKTAKTGPTLDSTTAAKSTATMAMAIVKEKRKESEEEKRKRKQPDAEAVVEL